MKQLPGGEEAFAEVALDDFFGGADGGEIGAGVPLEEEIEVEGELVAEVRWGGGEIWLEEGSDLCGGEGEHGLPLNDNQLNPCAGDSIKTIEDGCAHPVG